MASYPGSQKLTPEQWQAVAEQVLDGLTIRQAAAWILEKHGISVGKTTVCNNPEIKHAIANRNRMRKAEAQEAIGESLLPIVRGLTATLQDLQTERLALRAKQREHEPTSRVYAELGKQIRMLDISLKDYLRQYSGILELGQGSFDSHVAERSEKTDAIAEILGRLTPKTGVQERGQPNLPRQSENLLPLKLIQGGGNEGSESA